MAKARGAIVAFLHDPVEDMAELDRMNRGWRFAISNTTVVALAAAMAGTGLSYRELQGYAEAVASGHVASYSELQRWICGGELEVPVVSGTAGAAGGGATSCSPTAPTRTLPWTC